MDYLARREHSRRELQDKLFRKGFPETVAARVIAELETAGQLSDERYAEGLIRVRWERGYGPLRIQRELQQKGVDPEIVGRLLDFSAREWADSLQRVRRKKFGAQLPKTFAERARQLRFLHTRGFTSDQLQQALNPRDVSLYKP